jgi:DNA-binding NarL/FixJ family response regulator
MPRPCSVCGHSDRPEIDQALRGGRPAAAIARAHPPLTTDAVERHRTAKHHRDGATRKPAKSKGKPADEPRLESRPSLDESRKPRNEPPTGTALEAADRDKAILDLRIAGLSPKRIADRLGVSRETVRTVLHDAMEEALGERLALADRLLELELARLDVLQESLWDRATNPACAEVLVPADNEAGVKPYDGQDKAAALVLKISERRAKILRWEGPVVKDDTQAPTANRPVITIQYAEGIAPIDADPLQPAAEPGAPSPPIGQ